MPNPNAVVARVVRFEPPLDRPAVELLRADRGLTIVLDDDRRVRLDPGDPRSAGLAQLLGELSRRRLPVYIEFHPNTAFLTRLLIPHVARVLAVREDPADGLRVDLEFSHARHLLKRDQPDFDDLEKRLREAERTRDPVVVSEDDTHAIVDVRAFKPDPDGPMPPRPDLLRRTRLPWPLNWIRDLLRWIWWWPWWPWWWFCCLSMARAQQVFAAMSATSCNPLTVPPPCIPFLYPDDGCWGRAHEMCRLMINMGLSPRKVWIQGNLDVATRNNPNCQVLWGWHVAPTLCVRGPLFFWSQPMVIDPSLFTAPVSKATWKGVQGDPSATLTDTDASIFYLWGNVTDPTYAQTDSVLAFYRLQLQNRSIQQGPPPYANCP